MKLFTAWVWIDQEEFQKYWTSGGRMEPWIFWQETSIPPHSINTRRAHWLNTCSSSAALAGCCRGCACSMWTLLWGASDCGDLTGLDAKHRLYANSLLCYETHAMQHNHSVWQFNINSAELWRTDFCLILSNLTTASFLAYTQHYQQVSEKLGSLFQFVLSLKQSTTSRWR